MMRCASYLMAAIILLVAFESIGQTIQRCAGCSRVLLGEYIRVDNRDYHASCFKCAECGKAIDREYYSHFSSYFHRQCYERRFYSPCGVCGHLIRDAIHEDYWGGRYCASHLDSIPSCDFCGRLVSGPVTGRGLRLADGRQLCGVCRPSAVTNESQAKALACEVAAKMKSLGVTIDCTKPTFLLLGQDKLERLIADPRHTLLGYTEYNQVSNVESDVETECINILLLHGMPAAQAKAVLAHELMHVWLFERGATDIDLSLCEGSCNYASYLFLKDMGSIECNYIIRNMVADLDSVYGRGFRDVKQYAEANGVEAWLQLLAE